MDFSQLYDDHSSYAARRQTGSFEQSQIEIEVELFKLPQLLSLLPDDRPLRNVLEIGCATGELIARWPVVAGGRRVGVDLSPLNIEAARLRFPNVEFRCADFRRHPPAGTFDAVVLSDVLEHVEDDAGFLRAAAGLAPCVLINLPLEDNWLNARRHYGPHDVSGHLRRYSLSLGLALIERSGLQTLRYRRVWLHETAAESARRELRRRCFGRAYGGGPIASRFRQMAHAVSTALPPMARHLYPSNLFAIAVTPDPA